MVSKCMRGIEIAYDVLKYDCIRDMYIGYAAMSSSRFEKIHFVEIQCHVLLMESVNEMRG